MNADKTLKNGLTEMNEMCSRCAPHHTLMGLPRSSAFKLRSSEVSKILACITLTVSFAAGAKVTIDDAWVRETVPVQKTTGAFATVTSSENAKLVAVKSPVAKIVEIHSATMKGTVMQMHAV